MDFSKFNSREAAETPRDLQLKHPATGELLFNDGVKRKEPCIVSLIGTESRTAQIALRAIQKAKVKGDKKHDDQSLEDLHSTLVESAKPLIRGFKNIHLGTRAATLEDIDDILGAQLINGQDGEQSFVEQIMTFATKRANFMGNGSPS